MKYVVEKVKNGEVVTFNPRGNSMMPRIKSGQEITVCPVGPETSFEVGNVVLCRVQGKIFLHLISAIDKLRGYQISNNKGHINGWTKEIYGIVKGV